MKGIETKNDEELAAKKFEQAVQLVKSLPQKGSFQPSYSEAAKIYSFFKQAKFGPCNIPRPGFWDYISRAKWDAWAALGDLSKTQAMLNYVEEIKNLYVRVKELDEFKEREEEFANVLIPFCQANHIPMNEKLIDIVKKQNQNELDIGIDKTNGDEVHCKTNYVPSNRSNGNDFITDDDEIDKPKNEYQDHDHSILVENTISTELKTVKFLNNEGESDCENKISKDEIETCEKIRSNECFSSEINHSQRSGNDIDEEDEEIYCDTIDPESFVKFSENDGSFITTDSGVPSNKLFSPRKNANIEEISTDSPQECFQRELEKPLKVKSLKKQKDKKPKFRHHGIRSHKRLDDQNSYQGSSNSGNHRDNHSAQTQRNPTIAHAHHTLHNQRRGSNDRSDSAESYTSSGSNSSFSIGLKIVNSLEKMEDNMQSVLDRLDSIEKTIIEVTKPTTPWWKQYMPSKTVLIWTIWPVVVNILFYIYWKKINRQKIKKC